MSDPLTDVLAARRAYKQAIEDSRILVDRERAKLGRAIAQARQSGTSQTKVMTALELSREQVRVFENAYRNWDRDHPGVPLDLAS